MAEGESAKIFDAVNSREYGRDTSRQTPGLAVVTGASTGIGYELAKCCAEKGFDLVIAADEPNIHAAAQSLRLSGVNVEATESDLARIQGVDQLCAALNGQPVEVLIANAGLVWAKRFSIRTLIKFGTSSIPTSPGLFIFCSGSGAKC